MSEHIVPKRIYYTIFAILMVCTPSRCGRVRRSRPAQHRRRAHDRGLQGTLVVLFFMHVKYSTRLTWAVVVGSVFWLGILLVLTMSDYLTRAWRTYG